MVRHKLRCADDSTLRGHITHYKSTKKVTKDRAEEETGAGLEHSIFLGPNRNLDFRSYYD